MSRVLVIENNEDIREIILRKVVALYAESVTTCSLSEARCHLDAEDLALVISDVEESKDLTFWISDYLRKFRPEIPLALFIDEYRPLRNVPKLDSTVRVAVLKPDFQKLASEIGTLGVLRAR